MQIRRLHKKVDRLQLIHGAKKLKPIYGAGCIGNAKIMLIFMNPTARNVSCRAGWRGIRAPWLGTKNIWKLLFRFGYLSDKNFQLTQELKPTGWSKNFAQQVYRELAHNKIYVTNLAKCTQSDARSLKDDIFKQYLEILCEEILQINPQRVITFGNQVSSILLHKSIKVSQYKGAQKEILNLKNRKFDVYPVYYPVGQGMRNMPLAIKRIDKIIHI